MEEIEVYGQNFGILAPDLEKMAMLSKKTILRKERIVLLFFAI